MRRVAVTGIGAICGIGHNRHEFWSSLRTGASGIAPVREVDMSELRFANGAEVQHYRPADHFSEKQCDFMDRFAQFAVIAAREAAADSGIQWTSELRENSAIVTGSCVGGQATEDQGFQAIYKEGRNRVHPLTIPKTMANAGASHISMELRITGPSFTFSTACASSTHAIGHAFWMVRSGAVDLALAGGSEAPFSFGILRAWEAMRVVSPDTCRPFSKDRTGMILGEGAAMLVLEPLEAALARGAAVYGEIAGFGMSADAAHITQPSPGGAAQAMRMALRDARLNPEQIGYINAHGTGTLANDAAETTAIRQLFGPHAGRLAVSSTKSMHGHGLGAAGAFEASATLLALRHAVLPPTANYREADPDCDLDVIPNVARELAVEYALSNSFAFGGLNAVLAFRAHTT